jgi:hypothetical protein
MGTTADFEQLWREAFFVTGTLEPQTNIREDLGWQSKKVGAS